MRRMNTWHRSWGVWVVVALSPMGMACAQTPDAAAGSSLAAQSGCLNCHGAQPRGDAPAFLRMQERAAGRAGDRDAVTRHWMKEMRETATGWRAIVAHRQVTDAKANALFTWLASPASKPVK